MEVHDLFKQLGMGDPDMAKAREWVSYKKFQEAVPDILTLDEYISTVYKKAVTDNIKPHLWFSERYMVSKYFKSDTPATDEYVDNVVDRLELIKKRIPNDTSLQHIILFLNKVNEYVCTSRYILPKSVLVYLNEIYKTKGIN